ncbi:MAG TPA: site-2 protease family protein [Vicinamibacterales bacterium]|nr:site-2 protease family protein [Vicinamibacterales bacterium]
MLFAATLVSTTLWGIGYYLGFAGGNAPISLTSFALYANGLWYSAAVLAILGAHEMGHYLACRYYRIDASLPYFLPSPFLGGTLGAFIRIRQPIPDKRQLFDIGIAGPIAGFLVAVPVLFVGLQLSGIVKAPTSGVVEEYGEPLLLKGLMSFILGAPPEGYIVNAHPFVFAAWFGMLATALNLFPFGQLDGGHISYAVLGRRSTVVTYATLAGMIGLSFLAASWVLWSVLLSAMLYFLGPNHPRTPDEDVPLDAGRLVLAAFAVVMFVLCFTPVPVSRIDLLAGK